MFKCNECGYVFDEPKEFYEGHGFDSGPQEKWSVCPRCKESGFEEIEEVTCSRCGEVILKDETRLGDHLEWLCDVCYEDMNYE